MAVVRVDAEGRLTVPREALRALGVYGEGEVAIEVDAEHETVVLRPVEYEGDAELLADPDVRASIDRGIADFEAGRFRKASEADLRSLAPTDA